MAVTVCLFPDVNIEKKPCKYRYVIFTIEQLKVILTKPPERERGHLLPAPSNAGYNAEASPFNNCLRDYLFRKPVGLQ
jgi:hypothetical protein